jgi:hypothetical protein
MDERERGGGTATGAIEYLPGNYTIDQAWSLLSPERQAWARANAGRGLIDPYTGRETVYTYCRVDHTDSHPGLEAVGRAASYALVLFGGRGLAVSTGTTERFGGPGATTAWPDERPFARAVDPSTLRAERQRGVGGVDRSGGTARLLATESAATFGHLPEATQRFLLEPFAASGSPPHEAWVHAVCEGVGGRCRETFWVYAFDDRRVAFAYAVRSVPLTSGASGTLLANGSDEARALRGAGWTVAAWTAGVARP